MCTLAEGGGQRTMSFRSLPRSVADRLPAGRRPLQSGAAPRSAAARAPSSSKRDVLAAALGAPPKRKPAKTTALERPIASLGDDGEEDAGLSGGTTRRGVAAPAESRVFARTAPRPTREALAFCGGSRARAARPSAPIPHRTYGTYALAAAAKPRPKPFLGGGKAGKGAAAAAPPARPWLAPVTEAERSELEAAPKFASAAREQTAKSGMKALASLERREASADAAAEAELRPTVVPCFRCADCERLYETRPAACDARGHRVRQTAATRRLYCCGRCGNRKRGLDRAPRLPCGKCGGDCWRPAKAADLAKVAAKDAFRPALAEWTDKADVMAIVDL